MIYTGLIVLAIILVAVLIGSMVLSFMAKSEVDKYESGDSADGRKNGARYAEFAAIAAGVGLGLLLIGYGLAYFYYYSGESVEGMKANVKYATRKAKAPFQYMAGEVQRRFAKTPSVVEGSGPGGIPDPEGDVPHLRAGTQAQESVTESGVGDVPKD